MSAPTVMPSIPPVKAPTSAPRTAPIGPAEQGANRAADRAAHHFSDRQTRKSAGDFPGIHRLADAPEDYRRVFERFVGSSLRHVGERPHRGSVGRATTSNVAPAVLLTRENPDAARVSASLQP